MKKYKVKIVGVTPYMQHRMDDAKLEEWEKNRKKIIERHDISQEDIKRAMFHSYMDDKGKFYIPSEHVRGALIEAGALVKSKVGNSRKSMKNIVAGMFFVMPSHLPIHQNFVIDKRSAVNKNIKARIIVIRPKWEQWETEFELWVDNDTITKETVQEILENSGRYIGIGSFRPLCNGMYGRYEVNKVTLIS